MPPQFYSLTPPPPRAHARAHTPPLQAHDLCVTAHTARHRLAWNSIWRISEIANVIVQNLAPKDVVSIARTTRLLPESIVSCSRTAFLKIILHHYRVSSSPI